MKTSKIALVFILLALLFYPTVAGASDGSPSLPWHLFIPTLIIFPIVFIIGLFSKKKDSESQGENSGDDTKKGDV